MKVFDVSELGVSSSYNYFSSSSILNSEDIQLSKIYLSSKMSLYSFSYESKYYHSYNPSFQYLSSQSKPINFDSISFSFTKSLLRSTSNSIVSHNTNSFTSFSSSNVVDSSITIQISMNLIGESVSTFNVQKQSMFLLAISSITNLNIEKIKFISINDIDSNRNLRMRILSQPIINVIFTIEVVNQETANNVASLINDSVNNNELTSFLNSNGFNVYVILNEISLIGGDNTEIVIPIIQPIENYQFLCNCDNKIQCVTITNQKCAIENLQICLECDSSNQNYDAISCENNIIEKQNELSCSIDEIISNGDKFDSYKLTIILPSVILSFGVILYLILKYKKVNKISSFTEIVFSVNTKKNKNIIDVSNNKIQPIPYSSVVINNKNNKNNE